MTPQPDSPASAIDIVLVGTQHPGNLGAAARAIKTMGLRQLVLVAPEHPVDHPDAIAMAAGADDRLQAARVVASVEEAVAEAVFVLGCTARSRTVPLPELSPREAAARLIEAAPTGRVALLFGRERTGLTNDELQRCHAAVHIPADPAFSSLNLAASVQVLAYELRVGLLEAGLVPPRPAPPALDEAEPPATQGQLEGLFGHLGEALDDIDFHKGRAPEMSMQRLRRLFLRIGLDAREVRLLRGILSDAQRMARLARGG